MGVEFRSLTSLDFSDSDMHTRLVRKSIAFVQLLYALISILQQSCTLCRDVITTSITSTVRSFHLYGTRTKLQNQFWYNLFIFLVLSLFPKKAINMSNQCPGNKKLASDKLTHTRYTE